MPRLRVEDLHKAFNQKNVLEGVSFDVPAGGIMSIVGPSGCGKTTLFRCILGEIGPDGGRVLLDGQDVTRVPVEQRGVGIVYQSYALFPHMSVADNVAYGLRARGESADKTAARVREMLELVQLTGEADKFPDEISGGERQRVALARALAVKPHVLLLDEAFAALDATTRSDVVQEVRRIIRSMGVTTLLITHDQEEAFLFSHHVLVLNEGRIVVSGTPREVMAYDHPFIQEFVKMILLASGTVASDERGRTFVMLEDGDELPITTQGVKPGDEVHVMIKKGLQTESIDVWPYDAVHSE